MSRLNVLNAWAGNDGYFARRSAQSFFDGPQMTLASSGCGSSCGGDDPKPQTSACGAPDEQPKPASACGTPDEQPKPASACGSSCGTGDK